METGQLLERFRLLSRDIQNGLQTAQRHIDLMSRSREKIDFEKLSITLQKVDEAWQDFSGWILVSTLDDLNSARANCAPGRLDIESKITRARIRRQNDINNSGIKIVVSDVKSMVIETYIPYFEQALDLVFSNAIKYSTKGGTIDVSTAREGDRVIISISSVGPLVLRNEIGKLGEMRFRSENAKKLPVTGQGYGLYNVKLICELLGANVSFRPESRPLYEMGGIPYANFCLLMSFPDSPPLFARGMEC